MVTAETHLAPAPPTVHDRYDDKTIARFRERGWWAGGSAAALLDHWAAAAPTKTFISDGSSELDFATVRDQAYRLARELSRRGVRPGDRVAVQLPNWNEFVVSYLALARLGAVTVPIMMVYRDADVGHVLRNSGAVAAITTGQFRSFDHGEMFRTLRKEIPEFATLVIVRSQAHDDELSFNDIVAGSDVPSDAELGPHPDPDAPHAIVYTSGTESSAKGCVHTWNTISFSGRGLAADIFHMTADDVMFMPTPVAHATGLVTGVLVPLNVGAGSHLLDIWEPNEGLRRIERYRCTTSATATPFVRMAIDAAKGAEHRDRDLSSMRFWLCAGAPIPETLAVEFRETFGDGLLVPLYGCSEFMVGTCCHLGDPLEKMSSSDGTPALAGIQIKLVGPDGAEVAPGEEGEICYWGPGAILGYWRNPERTSAAIDPEGWYHTSDLGRADADGYVRVTGRLKDIIIRGGANISALEVEQQILTHPGVAGVAVVAYPDHRLGEKACAVVVPAPGATPTLEEITGYLRDERKVSPYKLPERLLLVDELPMTASGKIQKFRLRSLARGEEK